MAKPIHAPSIKQVLIICVSLWNAPLMAHGRLGSAPLVSEASSQPGKVVVTADDTVITTSCKVVIPDGTVIVDANGDGVIQIGADNIVVDFAEGSVLRGAPDGTPWDQLKGTGIRVNGHKGVTIWKAAVQGYRVGIYASDADKLEISNADLSDNYRQRLKSTPWAEDGSDWLYPHNNDDHEWMKNYGAALYVERTSAPVINKVKVRRGQNGIILDRVTGATMFENDCSFLSGWGVAMWRSSNNRVMRNKFDFCVRGYSHGVYNRGQDSAGILCFEQCSNNVFAENSATHCGDGFFGFAGNEAIGERAPREPGYDYTRKGCNDNLLIDNDFSYGAAHGIEMTFSYGNRYWGNWLIGDAICGIWAGYSHDSTIANNRFERNGDGAYGLERGGVNIEHGANNRIIQNNFHENACAVHLWWDDDKGLLEKPGVKANYRDVAGNVVANNSFDRDAIALQLRDTGSGHVKDTLFVGNEFTGVRKQVDATPGAEPVMIGAVEKEGAPPAGPMAGTRQPKNVNKMWIGRDKIIMTDWGPGEVSRPEARLGWRTPSSRTYELFYAPFAFKFEFEGPGLKCEPTTPAAYGGRRTFTVKAEKPGVYPYTLRLLGERYEQSFSGTIVGTPWNVTYFRWEDGTTDPRQDLGAWRGLGKTMAAGHAAADSLSLRYSKDEPRELEMPDSVPNVRVKPDHVGIIATSSVPLTKGPWRVSATSDDGVRVTVNGKTVIENWTVHGAAADTGTFAMEADGTAEITVEYFQVSGGAVLDFWLERAE